LFGRSNAGLSHDFPGALEGFVARTDGRLGSVEDVLWSRTTAGLLLRFQSGEIATEVAVRLANGSVGGLKARLGLLASRFDPRHSLTACSRCMKEDLDAFGTSLWHLPHQGPGVFVCHRHACLLGVLADASHGLGQFEWRMPDSVSLRPPGGLAHQGVSPELDRFVAYIAGAVADMATWLRTDRTGHSLVARALKERLIACGFASEAGRVRTASAGPAFSRTLDLLKRLPTAAGVDSRPEAALCSLRRLIDPDAKPAHMLRYLSCAYWLFPSWAEFRSALRDTGGASRAEIQRFPREPSQRGYRTAPEECRRDFLDLLQRGLSVSGASRAVGVAVQTGQAWASQSGHAVPRRPKYVAGELADHLIRDLQRGASRDQVARKFEVSKETVTRYLRTVPGLRELRRERDVHRRRASARKAWEHGCAKYGQGGPTEVRRHAKAEYAWLRRHDSEWLAASVARLPAAVRAAHPRADWEARDRTLSAAIGKVTGKRSLQSTSMSLAGISRLVPALRPYLGRLEQLPKTRRLLETAVSRHLG
jgi:transposase